MHVSTLDLKGLQEAKMPCSNFITDLETGICANMFGNLKNSIPLPVQDAEDALTPVLEKSIKMSFLWNL